MPGLRETRLSRGGDQNRDGLFNGPLVGSSSADDLVQVPPIAWSDLAVDDSTPPTICGKLYSYTGYGVGILVAGSDPNTLVSIAWENGQYKTLAPGVFIEAPGMFTRFFLKRGAGLPTTGNTFNLVVSQTRYAKVQNYFGAGAANAGAANWTNTKNGTPTGLPKVSNTAINVCPARQGRWQVNVKNDGPADVFLGPAATVNAGNGRQLVAGESVVLQTNAAVWAVDPTGTGSDVDATEIYA